MTPARLAGILAPAWAPSSLFGAGDVGFALDFASLSTMRQNSDGTGAVAADGDPIGYVSDQSGKGNHATQATSGARPVWSASNGGAAFTSARVATPAINVAGQRLTLIMCIRMTTSGSNQLLCESSAQFNTVTGALNITVGTTNAITFSARGSAIGTRTTPNVTAPCERVISCEYDLSQSTLDTQIAPQLNSVPPVLTNASSPLGGVNWGNHAWHIGARSNGTLPLSGAVIYRMLVIGRLLTADEYAAAKTWCGAPIGYATPSSLASGAASYVNHIISYGQSLSVGVAASPVISTSQRFDSRMFSGGVRAQDAGPQPWLQHASLVPLIEAAGAPDGGLGNRNETPLSGLTEMVHEIGGAVSMICSAPGRGGQTISALSGGQLFERVEDDISYGHWRAGAAHKMPAFVWLQGESETTGFSTYPAALETLRGKIDRHAKAATGQPDDVWCISYQLDRAAVGLQHIAASDTYSRIRVALPIYFLPRTDGVHFTPQSSKVAGAYLGMAYKALILDGDTSWQPLKCTSVSVAGAVADLTYNRSGLTFDTTTVAAQTNHGFRLVDSGGSALTISSVAIVGGSTVRITAAAPIPAGASVRYGFASPTNTTAAIDKGNLRDSQGGTVVFDGGGINWPMHNWAVLQSIALP